MPEYAGHKMSKKDLDNFHKDMKDMAKKQKPPTEKEMNDMAKEYNKEAMEVYTSYLDELKTSTLTSYKKKAESDKERLRDRAHELVQRDSQQLGGRYSMPDADNAADKYERADRREKGIAMAKKKIDKKKVDSAPRLTKEAKANPKDYYEVSGTKLTKQLMDKLVKARKKEMNDKKVLKGTPVHYEEYGAGFMGTDALRKKYENETPGQNTNPYKLAVDGVPTKDGIKKPMVETKGAPKGYHFTRSGKLRKGDANQDGPGGKMLRSDPLDKQRSKIPPLPEEVNKKDEKGLKKLSDMLKGSAGAHLDQKKKLDKLIANEEKFKVKNCGCDKDPCETYGSKEEQMKAHMEGYMGDQIKDRIKSKLHPDRMERNKAARRADTRKHNRQVVQSAIKSEIGRMMQNKEKKMDEGIIIERMKISAVTPKGRKTYRYAVTPVDAQKKVAQLRKSGHASISTVEEQYVSEGKMKDLYMKQQAEAERKKLMQKSKPKKKEPNKIMKDIGYSGRMANEENLNELDTDTIKSAYDKRKKQAFDHEYAAGDHASSAEHAKTKEAEKTHRAFQKQRQAMHMKASKGKAIANRALKRKGYSGALDYRLQKGGEDDRYEDERKGRLKENYRRQTGYRKPANWKTNANHLVGQKGNNLTKGRNMVYLLKYLISRSGLAK